MIYNTVQFIIALKISVKHWKKNIFLLKEILYSILSSLLTRENKK